MIEAFFDIGYEVLRRLADARKTARDDRMKANRTAGCGARVGETGSRALLLRGPRSRMS
jgi:hypothetical protein